MRSRHIYSKIIAFLGLFAVAISSVVKAAPQGGDEKDPLALSEKMALTSQKQSFKGVFTHLYDSQVETLSIHHTFQEDRLFERLVALNGPYRELIKRGEELFGYYDPNDEQAAKMGLANPLPLITKEMVPLIPKNYQLVYEGESRVAGKSAAILFMKPMSDDRYAHRFWVHEASGLLLRHDVIAMGKGSLQSVIFTQIELTEELPGSLFEPKSKRHMHTHDLKEKPKKSWSDIFRLNALPKGFVNTEKLMRFSSANKNAFEHWVFTDGIAKISIFFESHPEVKTDHPVTPVMKKGATLAYGKLMGGHLITLVGDVPESTARKVLEAIEYQ